MKKGNDCGEAISNSSLKLNSRLKSELRKLRKKYREETDKAKNEFMNVHSKQVRNSVLWTLLMFYRENIQISELQSTLSQERSTNKAAVENLKLTQEKMEELRKKLEYNEGVNIGLNKEVSHLSGILAQRDQDYKCEVSFALAVIFIICQLWFNYS